MNAADVSCNSRYRGLVSLFGGCTCATDGGQRQQPPAAVGQAAEAFSGLEPGLNSAVQWISPAGSAAG